MRATWGARKREGVGAAAQVTCREDPTGEWAQGHARSRTVNMLLMLVTLDVSKLSGWLNASACCRVQRENTMRATWRARRREGVGVAASVTCREDPTGEWVAWARAEPHPKHVVHSCDFGRVET